MSQWTREAPQGPKEVARAHRTFPDGVDVILVIQRLDVGFELLDSAESRTSGPVEVSRGEFTSLADAEAALTRAAREWDRDLDPSGQF